VFGVRLRHVGCSVFGCSILDIRETMWIFFRCLVCDLNRKIAGARGLPITAKPAMKRPSQVAEIDSVEHRRVARQAAEEGSVLLINQHQTLPLDAKAIRTVAVVGPFGDGPHAPTAMLGGCVRSRF
jgi:hypothetical protein